jgi:four helix bundle protein
VQHEHIPSNTAEGHGRTSTREFLHHLSIAYGSLMEAETQMEISHQLGYIEDHQWQSMFGRSQEIGRMLNGLMASLDKRLEQG